MNRLSTITTLALALSFSSCDQNDSSPGNEIQGGDSQYDGAKQEEIANQVMDAMTEYSKAISTVSDAKSAKSAAAKLKEIGRQFSTLAEELKPLAPPTEKVRASIHRKMDAREAEMEKVMREKFVLKLQSLSPEAQKTMEKSLEGFFEVMQQVGPEFDRHFKVEK